MTRTTTLIATGLTTLALSACGTAATQSSSSSPVKPAAPATTQVALTASEAHTGYFNMTALQNDISAQETARMADPTNHYYLPGIKVQRTNCIQSGPQTATCVSSLSNGARPTATATISTDGQHYITH